MKSDSTQPKVVSACKTIFLWPFYCTNKGNRVTDVSELQFDTDGKWQLMEKRLYLEAPSVVDYFDPQALSSFHCVYESSQIDIVFPVSGLLFSIQGYAS